MLTENMENRIFNDKLYSIVAGLSENKAVSDSTPDKRRTFKNPATQYRFTWKREKSLQMYRLWMPSWCCWTEILFKWIILLNFSKSRIFFEVYLPQL